VFIGHFAVGFAAKKAAPGVSLVWQGTAALLPDLLFPAFLLLGWERLRIVGGANPLTAIEFTSYPFSHSLAGTGVLAAGIGLACWLATRSGRGALVVAVAALSHWLLDALTHRPDMPLYPGGPVVGLGLWNSPAATVLVEGSMFIAAVWIYSTATRAVDRIGRWALVALIALLALLYVKFITGPPPPAENAFAFVGLLSGGLFPVWLWWIDRHRAATG